MHRRKWIISIAIEHLIQTQLFGRIVPNAYFSFGANACRSTAVGFQALLHAEALPSAVQPNLPVPR